MDGILYLIRHTRPNIPEGICYGQTDADVTADFEKESSKIISKLMGVSFSCYFSSPLIRCKKLAFLISDSVIIDNRLAEMSFGEWEGTSWNSIYSTPKGHDWFLHYTTASCPGGESFPELRKRVAGFLSDISKREGNILVITHAGVMRAISVCLGIVKVNDVFDLKIPTGSILKIERDKYQVI